MAKPVLGRGLSALLGGGAAAPGLEAASRPTPTPAPADPPQEGVRRLPVARVVPCPFQPRKDFSEESLRELADSIREQGIVQPLIVRQRGENFELIAGERRWRAAQMLNLTEVPVLVREADDRTVLELALIENLQRENLNPMEEALGYSQLIGHFELTQEAAAARVGKSRTVVANALRLLKLAPEVQTFVRTGSLSVGHAKVILGLPTWEEQKLAAAQVLKRAFSVRQTEDFIGHWQKKPGKTGRKEGAAAVTTDAHVADLQQKLTERLGTKVALHYKSGQGSIEIKFFNDDDLERVLQIVGVSVE